MPSTSSSDLVKDFMQMQLQNQALQHSSIQMINNIPQQPLQSNLASQLQNQFPQHQMPLAPQYLDNRPLHNQAIREANSMQYYYATRSQQSWLPGQQHQSASASDQLEVKYRNDIIEQTRQLQSNEITGDDLKQNQTKQQQQETTTEQRDDDIEFWQALSQKYNGPTTGTGNVDSTEKIKSAQIGLANLVLGDEEEGDNIMGDYMRSEDKILSDFDEYHFDERNPLKDQFEDPFAEGLKRLEQGDIPSAALLFEAAVQKDSTNAIAWRYLGTTQAQNEKDMSAIRALRNCLKLDQLDQEARLAIAVSLANESYQYEACKHLVDWLINNGRYKVIGASLEQFHLFDAELSNDPFYANRIHEKHYKYVRNKFVEAARMSPSNPDPEVQNALGVLFNMRGEYEKAVDCFKAALSVKSNDSLLWNRLGATLANGNKSDDAVIAYKKALAISPGFLRSRYNLAISLIHLNTYDEAAKQLVQILNTQAAGKGTKNSQIRTRSITSSAIWNTLRTVATLMNRPDLYPMIEGRDLQTCNREILKNSVGGN